MAHYKLALLGFGNVGRALARLLMEKRSELLELYGLSFSITGIATGRHGMAVNTDGLDLALALDAEKLDPFCVGPVPRDAFEFIQRCEADVLFENTPVNYVDGQPAIDHLRVGLELGLHGITANKGPVVHAYRQLLDLAKARGRKFYFESTVMDGAPIFSLFRETLPSARLLSFRGVLNSTTNMILTLMERGESFAAAVSHCQEIGIAETDPSGDINGWDAAVKVSALVTVLMDTPIKPNQVERTGIRGIGRQEITRAQQEGKRWKLVCSADRNKKRVTARVAPELIGPESPLFGVEGTTSIVQFETDVLGLLSVVEMDPGPHTTAYGLLADFINAVLG